MKIFLIVTTAFSVTLVASSDYFDDSSFGEAITMNCPDECPLLYQPICAGGVNYANQCELDCENRHRREMFLPDLYPACHQTCAKCRIMERKTRRPKHNNPYKRLQETDLSVALAATLLPESASLWECPQCAVEHNRHKVCAENGVTFSSLCLLDCENLRRVKRGSEPLELKCNTACSECHVGDAGVGSS